MKRTRLSEFRRSGSPGDDHLSEETSGNDDSTREQGGLRKEGSHPNRISIRLYGLEWFIYNRIAAYESILAGFRSPGDEGFSSDNESSPSPPNSARPKNEQDTRNNQWDFTAKQERTSASSTARPASEASSRHEGSREETFSSRDSHGSKQGSEEPLSVLLQLLPIQLSCSKGAIVAGNENTKSVLTATFGSATGAIDAGAAGPFDLYRQILSFRFSHPIIQLRPNPDFKQSQLTAAKGLNTRQQEAIEKKRKRGPFFNYRLRRQKIWHKLRTLVPYFQSSVESFHFHSRRDSDIRPRSQTELSEDTHWAGLSRYLDDSLQDDHDKWRSVEYGRISTFLDSASMEVTYYWDIPGRVLSHHATSTSSDRRSSQDINGTSPPEWGLDFKIDGGSVDYGPWTDRERVWLQNVMFPNSYRDSQPAEFLRPGDLRQSTVFKLRVEFSRETTLRIPTREPSRDWQWRGRADAIRSAWKSKKQKRQGRKKEGEKTSVNLDVRPFGWLSLRMERDSTISYTMDMVTSGSEYRNQLTVDLRDSKMSTSVNHGLLWQCPRQLITCDLTSPLSWNSLRSWDFKVESQELELFLLRDHIFLLTDLVDDWTTGPSPDYYTFVPFIYNIKLLFKDFKLFMNVNDLNIISNPSDLDDNHFLVIKGKQLTSDVMIPLDKYRPEQNAVVFNHELQDGGIDALTPVWDTLHTFLPDKSTATLDNLLISGTYNYNLSTMPDLTDTLILNIEGGCPKLYMFGFLVRSFLTVKTNYFGEDMHFKTLEEFQEETYTTEPQPAHIEINPEKTSNDLDVIVHVTADNPCALLPENIYEHLKSARLEASSLEADLRFTNYYMDLNVSISPLKLSLESQEAHGTVVSGTQMFIDGLSVYGHRLFGLPPAEPTYVCNWDFKVGNIISECSTEFLSCLIAGVSDFGMSFDNHENALPPPHPVVIHDVTFLRVAIDSVHMSVLLDEAALVVSTGLVTARFNDWADSKFSERVSLLAPDITVAAIDLRSVDEVRSLKQKKVTPNALFKTSIRLRMAKRNRDIDHSRRLQQEHISVHDQTTHRTQWLLFGWEDVNPLSFFPNHSRLHPPNKAVPSMPEPISTLKSSMSGNSVRRSFGVDSKSDFRRSFLLSSDNSSMNSVRKHPARNVNTARGRTPEIGRIQASASPGQRVHSSRSNTAHQLGGNRVHELNEDPSAFSTSTSNPWTVPPFLIYRIELDTSELPSHKTFDYFQQRDATDRSSTLISEDDQSTQTNFYFELPLGIQGFCTPSSLTIISALVKEFQPTHPVEIIDSLQKEVVSDIVGYEKAMEDPKQTSNYAIRVPSVDIKLVNPSDSPEGNDVKFQDEYSIGVSQLRAELRTKVTRQKDDLFEGIKQSYIIRTDAKRLSVSVEGNQYGAFHENAGLNCLFGDMAFWFSTSQAVQSHLKVRSFETVTSTKSVEHLACLVRRTATTIDSVTSSFQRNLPLSDERLRVLVYRLTLKAADIPDPSFLTRMSSVLRLAPNHLRQHDSWKIISRLRNVYKNLSSVQRRDLVSKCLSRDLALPEDAKSVVYSTFDKWRTWDLAHVGKSYVMRRVWGSDEPESDDALRTPMSLSANVKSLRFSIDSGPKESDFIIEDLSTAITSKPKHYETQAGSSIFEGLTVVQSYCSSAALRLKWEILDLVEGVARIMSTVAFDSTTKETPQPEELHVVFGTDVGSITLDGINIKLALLGRALRGSVVHSPRPLEKMNALTVLLSAGASSYEFSSLTRVLMLWRCWNPCGYLSQTSRERDGKLVNDWRIAGSSKKVRYDVKDDPVNLTHTADRLIADEVRQVTQLIRDINIPASHTQEKPAAKMSIHNHFRIALFLDDYRIRFHLLPSLVYTISGYVARMSLEPRESSKFEVDFDLKEAFHVFSSEKHGKLHNLSVLEIPPINGRVLIEQASNRTDIEIDTTIEPTYLEAGAIRSLLSILTDPVFSHMVSDAKQNVEILKLHLGDVVDSDQPLAQPEEQRTGNELFYKARFTIAGMEIHVTAPGVSGDSYSADMGLRIGLTQMHLDNGMEQEIPMEYPQFGVDISQVLFDLSKHEATVSRSYGSFAVGARAVGTSAVLDNGEVTRAYHVSSEALDIQLYAESATLVVDIASYLQEGIKMIDIPHEVKRFRRLRRRGLSDIKSQQLKAPDLQVNEEPVTEDLFDAMFSLQLENIQVAWNMSTAPSTISGYKPEDLIFSVERINLSNKGKNTAKLRIENMQLQMVALSADRRRRSLNSALMPEMVFNVAHFAAEHGVSVAFQAAGKPLDLRLTSDFVLPGSMLQNSISSASKILREANVISKENPSPGNDTPRKLFGNKRLQSVLVDIDFSGGMIAIQGRHSNDQQTRLTAKMKGSQIPEGRFGKYVQGDVATAAMLQTPGIALKVQFEDKGGDDSALNAELNVDASTNILYPTLVPLIKQMSETIKEVMGEQQSPSSPSMASKFQSQTLNPEPPDEGKGADAIFGKCKVNMGILIRKQEFSLSCQPVARVAATTKFDKVYMTVNTVQSDEHGRFIALLVAFDSLQASVKHVYSNESTARFEVESIVMSIMNSKHFGSMSGISAALKVSPMTVALNAKQVQDFLLFREIWWPSTDDSGDASDLPTSTFDPQSTSETQPYIVRRYQQVASAPAFPWNSTVAIEKLEIQLDLGSALGKSNFAIGDFWMSSKKTSDWEQTLYVNFDTVKMESKGRMSGAIELRNLNARTSIQWPDQTSNSDQTPLIQASAKFNRLQGKVSFDYQPFLVADIAMFEFLMYNVQGTSRAQEERLFSILDGEKVLISCTALTAAQSMALFQAWQRLAQDKQAAYEASLRDVERFLRRKSSATPGKTDLHDLESNRKADDPTGKAPISLQSSVVVTIKTFVVGVFPSSLFDNQIFKMEAFDAQARFAVSFEQNKIHSALGLTLGHLGVALSNVNRVASMNLEELSVTDVINRVINSRGGTILKVPRLLAGMETWQSPGSSHIEYIFTSTFEGKVDVGWNYSRISFIRDMWESHSRALASRLGKPIQPLAVRITGGGPSSDGDGERQEQQGKITAVVDVPQSKYTYTALAPPIIETPQLRDMGEATPPLEWIGLQRDRLPNVTHQMIIVTLLEIAKEVEDAYGKILGSS